MCTLCHKNFFAIFPWDVVVGSKGCVWEVTVAIGQVAAFVWNFEFSMGAFAEAACDVVASMWAVQPLC